MLSCDVHVVPVTGGGFKIGCSFAGELSDAELEALGVEHGSRSRSDERRSPRSPATGQVVYARVNHVSDPSPADVHNISLTGVAIFVPRSLLPGELLELELKDGDGHSVVTIVACVVYVSRIAAGRWLVGCNFIQNLLDNELAAMLADGP